MRRAGFGLALALLLSPRALRANDPISLGIEAKAILQTHCANCHGGGKAAKGGFGFVLDREQLVGRNLILPGKPGQSDLFQRIQQGEMPPPGRKERPGAAEINTLKKWIEAGAPPFDQTARTARPIPEREVPGQIQADLEKLDPRRRRFTRYLTLNHLALAGKTPRDLDTTREAVNKLLNSLSWHPRISLTESLADGLILRLDLRAYKWNASLWEKLASVYPYTLDRAGQVSRSLAKMTGSEIPALRADWFVGAASRPPLYHDLLQLPNNDRGLERILQVDVPGDIQDDGVQRSGFNDSGVSKNNRLLQRHAAAHGALWRSYDFDKNTGRQNLFDHPLGPNTGATSFQPAGGEMIFHLPNGLQGYFLMDALGRRLDKAPGEIVADPRRPDQRVETGISCMSCHARGLIVKADQLRGHVEKNAQVFGPDILASVRALHPRKAAFQAQIEEDNVRYLKALESFGLRDPDQEPVNLVTQRFEATLDGRTAAAELGLTLSELSQLLKQDRDMARILGGLLTPGGTVQRQVFEEKFPELARQLSLIQAAIKDSGGPKTAFRGHVGTVNALAYSFDGKRVASGGDDKTIRIWDAADGKLLTLFRPEGGEITAVAFSPDGKYLLAGGTDRNVRLWDIAADKLVRVFPGHTGPIRAVAFSPDGAKAVSGGDDRCLRLRNLSSGDELACLEGHSQPITSIAWSADGKSLLSGGRDGVARWWRIDRAKASWVLEGHVGPVLCVALAANGKTALTGGNDKTVRAWNLETGKEIHVYRGHDNAVIQVQMIAGGAKFNSSSSQHKNQDRTWRRWDVPGQKELGSRAFGPDFSFGAAVFSPDGQQVLVGGVDGFIRSWNW